MSPKERIRIFLTDDHEMVLEGLCQLLNTVREFDIVGRATSGFELMKKISKKPVDIILMDFSMPRMNGFEATKEVKEKFPEIKVIILSMYSSRKHVSQATEAGADGYISKSLGKKDIIEGIKKVFAGGFVVSVDSDPHEKEESSVNPKMM